VLFDDGRGVRLDVLWRPWEPLTLVDGLDDAPAGGSEGGGCVSGVSSRSGEEGGGGLDLDWDLDLDLRPFWRSTASVLVLHARRATAQGRQECTRILLRSACVV
jgi:hypothetical protein